MVWRKKKIKQYSGKANSQKCTAEKYKNQLINRKRTTVARTTESE